MNINIKNNEIGLINFTGTVAVNEDDNTVSFLDVILREPEETKSVAEYCKMISEQNHENMLLKESIKEFEERYKKDKEQIEKLENNIEAIVEKNNSLLDKKDKKIEELEKELNLIQGFLDEPEEEEEEELFDDYEDIPEMADLLEIVEAERKVMSNAKSKFFNNLET